MKSTHKEMRPRFSAQAGQSRFRYMAGTLVGVLLLAGAGALRAQVSTTGVASNPYQGSVVTDKLTDSVLPLSLDEAIHRGLQHNLGLLLQSQDVQSASGQRLQQLQSLLPTVTGSAKVAVAQTNLRAQGLRFPGFPEIIGPYGYTDLRASLTQSLLNVQALDNYLAAKHNFASSKLTAQDARDLVVLTVGNAYLTCVADAASVDSARAQLATARVSLDQAVANHNAGVSPKLDLLRAQVDYQSQQQQLIVAQNMYEKDKLALARAIGLPLAQQFALTDKTPYAELDHADPATAVQQAEEQRSDLKSLEEQVKAAQLQRKAAAAERFPTVSFSGDYGDIGVNPGSSHGTGSATGSASVPIFEEPKLRGDARVADAALEQKEAQLNNMKGQIDADVRDSILDIETAARLVQVAQSNVELAREALTEAQERFKAGVADNLPVSQAQAQLEQADSQYISALYQHNVAKLSLARALGVADTQYKSYLGGK